jgi:hypothetical protein
MQTYFFISKLCHFVQCACYCFYFDNVLPMETSFCITFGSISFGGQGLGGVFFFFVFITRKKVKIIGIKRRKIDLKKKLFIFLWRVNQKSFRTVLIALKGKKEIQDNTENCFKGIVSWDEYFVTSYNNK